jgi:hypothetical protein
MTLNLTQLVLDSIAILREPTDETDFGCAKFWHAPTRVRATTVMKIGKARSLVPVPGTSLAIATPRRAMLAVMCPMNRPNSESHRGWHGYFGFCQTPHVLTNLEAKIRPSARMRGSPAKVRLLRNDDMCGCRAMFCCSSSYSAG